MKVPPRMGANSWAGQGHVKEQEEESGQRPHSPTSHALSGAFTPLPTGWIGGRDLSRVFARSNRRPPPALQFREGLMAAGGPVSYTLITPGSRRAGWVALSWQAVYPPSRLRRPKCSPAGTHCCCSGWTAVLFVAVGRTLALFRIVVPRAATQHTIRHSALPRLVALHGNDDRPRPSASGILEANRLQ